MRVCARRRKRQKEHAGTVTSIPVTIEGVERLAYLESAALAPGYTAANLRALHPTSSRVVGHGRGGITGFGGPVKLTISATLNLGVVHVRVYASKSSEGPAGIFTPQDLRDEPALQAAFTTLCADALGVDLQPGPTRGERHRLNAAAHAEKQLLYAIENADPGRAAAIRATLREYEDVRRFARRSSIRRGPLPDFAAP